MEQWRIFDFTAQLKWDEKIIRGEEKKRIRKKRNVIGTLGRKKYVMYGLTFSQLTTRFRWYVERLRMERRKKKKNEKEKEKGKETNMDRCSIDEQMTAKLINVLNETSMLV